MAAHWSRDMYSLWWLDRGTLRMRVSFSRYRESLLERLARVWHDRCDAAMYAPDGERLPLSRPKAADEPKGKPKKKAKQKKKAKVAPVATAPLPVAA